MHFYTSVNINYLPKARVLAKSVKKYCRDARFSLVLSDRLPEDIKPENEPFDEILTVEQLGIPVKNLHYWIFIHTVVELCTAVKGQALVKFLEEGSQKVVYLDPDTAIFNDLSELEHLLDKHDIILTPHQASPEKTKEDIVYNEICSLMHGAYNFGFYAVRNSENGMKFARWWRDRLTDFCYDDIPGGLFTDQKWGDLVPAMFDGVHILRDPSYNVSTWNLTNRLVTKDDEGKYLVNGIPLKFYHFSGFDSGAQERMLNQYAHGNQCLYELRAWYIGRMRDEGQEKYGSVPSVYNFYSNGEKIGKSDRVILRNRADLLKEFGDTNPYMTDGAKSYYKWYQNEKARFGIDFAEDDSEKAKRLENELFRIYHSRSWKLVMFLKRIKNALGGQRS